MKEKDEVIFGAPYECQRCHKIVRGECRCSDSRTEATMQEEFDKQKKKPSDSFGNWVKTFLPNKEVKVPIPLFGHIAYFITDTGATISIEDFNCLSTDQQEKCVPMYHNTEITTKSPTENKEPYGWVIEQNSTVKYSSDAGKTWKWTRFSGWDRAWKHKVYKTKEIALEAIKASKIESSNHKTSYRILPVYSGEPEVLDNVMDLPLKIEEDGIL